MKRQKERIPMPRRDFDFDTTEPDDKIRRGSKSEDDDKSRPHDQSDETPSEWDNSPPS